VNDTAFEYFFTGAETLRVKAIEGFEVADAAALSAEAKQCASGL
jgi:hypothetical protein